MIPGFINFLSSVTILRRKWAVYYVILIAVLLCVSI